jgi:hypothetical protein
MITEVKDLAIEIYKERRAELHDRLDAMKFEGEFVRVPIIIDCVLDTLVYRVKDKKFIAIEMEVDDTQSVEAASSFSKTAVYSDRTRTEILTIPEDLQ